MTNPTCRQHAESALLIRFSEPREAMAGRQKGNHMCGGRTALVACALVVLVATAGAAGETIREGRGLHVRASLAYPADLWPPQTTELLATETAVGMACA